MCLLFFSYQTTPGYRLVVAANRDEFLDRPTAPLNFFDEEKTVLAGLDLQGGGTWLGITSNLKFGAITNYRELTSVGSDAPTRGEIITNYFASSLRAEQYITKLAEQGDKYSGFNLILGDSSELYYYSNRAAYPILLEPGFYGLSNHLLDSPWPKVVRGKELLYSHMVATDHIDPQRILNLLGDDNCPPDGDLPDTGVGLEWERLLSSIFIDSSGYGTRSSAVITVSENSLVEFTEKTINRSTSKPVGFELTSYTMNS